MFVRPNENMKRKQKKSMNYLSLSSYLALKDFVLLFFLFFFFFFFFFFFSSSLGWGSPPAYQGPSRHHTLGRKSRRILRLVLRRGGLDAGVAATREDEASSC